MALYLNKALVIGNLTRDPEFRTTPSGQSLCTFGVATTRRWKDQTSGEQREVTEFHNIVAWGKVAEIIQQHLNLKKGGKVFVEGRLQTRSWEDQAGQKRNRTEIVTENIIPFDRKPAATSPQPSADSSQPAADQPADDVRVEDIPF